MCTYLFCLWLLCIHSIPSTWLVAPYRLFVSSKIWYSHLLEVNWSLLGDDHMDPVITGHMRWYVVCQYHDFMANVLKMGAFISAWRERELVWNVQTRDVTISVSVSVSGSYQTILRNIGYWVSGIFNVPNIWYWVIQKKNKIQKSNL